MNFSYFYQASPITKLFLSGIISFSCFILTFILAVLFAIPIFGIGPVDLLNALSDINNPDNLNLLKYLQIAQSAGLFLIPPFILGYLFSGSSFNYLKVHKSPTFSLSLIGILIILTSLPIINFLTEINLSLSLPEWLSSLEGWMQRSEEAAKKLTEAFLAVDTTKGLLLNLLMIAVIPALGEEFLFRGVIQRIFIEWTKNIHWGILISALLFSAMHFQFYGFLPRTMLGMLFGYLFVYSGSIWYPVIAHFFNNAMAVLVYFFAGKETVEKTIDQFGTQGVSVYFVLLAIILLYLLMRFFRSNFRPA
jgi:uncharacterized protein